MTVDESTSLPSRYIVGLDLGTTNSAMAFVDTVAAPGTIVTFSVPQVVAPGSVEARESLPSFLYLAAKDEFAAGALQLPWDARHPTSAVGVFARDQGTLAPGRLVSSAKSWLCHAGVDRTADLLPWQGASDVERVSPVEVSSRYLQHYRQAWDFAHPEYPLSEQDFVLTIPASFDEVARELTIRAAQQAGLNRVYLIEEPQAAFYAWIDKHAGSWDQHVQPGQTILVCDIGGGTSDFTLIRVRRGQDGLVQFQRVAVGEHLILGGDNFDLALAHLLERKIKGDSRLDPRTWSVLVRSCRQLKETLLGPNPPEQVTLSLPGSGSRLIASSLQIPVTRAEVAEAVLDGFFPWVPLDARPQAAQSGFQEFGLPYAADPAITKYLADFLRSHRFDRQADSAATPALPAARPDLLLFNGGVFESTAIRARLLEQLQVWFQGSDPDWSLQVLDNERLDLAVARGAAYYGRVRRGDGVRIAAGLARTYYVGVSTENSTTDARTDTTTASTATSPTTTLLTTKDEQAAFCLCPAGMEPGEQIELSEHEFELRLSEPIELPLYCSSTRLTDQPGDLIPVEREQLTALPPIRTVFKSGKTTDRQSVKVMLSARLTEIGTLDLWCREVEGPRRWKLLFDIRSATRTEITAKEATGNLQGVVNETLITAASLVIETTFRNSKGDPGPLIAHMGEALELPRQEWPPTVMRRLWEVLLEVENGRRWSAQHESRWLNLTGFCLRPGYGVALDDWRVAETWKRLHGKLFHATSSVRSEWWILWRRLAGGLTAGQQQSLAGPLTVSLKDAVRAAAKPRSHQPSPHELAEQCRLLGSLESLPVSLKTAIGGTLLDILASPRTVAIHGAARWALGRLGARWPVYGPLNAVVSTEVASEWIERLLKIPGDDLMEHFALVQLARMTGDRYREIPGPLRDRVLHHLQQSGASDHSRKLVREVALLEQSEQGLVFGESLPQGLRIL